jgi:hypothetical protein
MTAALPAEEVLTEKATFAELITWSKDRPRWQQDALRRLALNHTLGPLLVLQEQFAAS